MIKMGERGWEKMMKIISLPISEGAILKPRSKFNFIALEIEGKIGLLVFCALAILWGFN